MPTANYALSGLVLAAGSSSRLGRPKQLLQWRGKSLVRHAVEQCLDVCNSGIVVVIGAQADEIAAGLSDLDVQLVVNPDWREGVATSLAAGIGALRLHRPQGVLISVCDQPMVYASDLARLAELWKTAPIQPAAARYNGKPGVPAIFPASYLDRIAGLNGDVGARALLRDGTQCSMLDLPAAAMDIDTAEDFERLHGYDS